MFNPPANLNDFEDHPDLRPAFDQAWNQPASGDGRYCGAYVETAVQVSKNYVDPRVEPPQGAAVKIPWNGFPRLISRHFNDENDPAAREPAEAAADEPTPVVYWVAPDPADDGGGGGARRLSLHSALQKDLGAYGPLARSLARPLREIRADGTLGDEVRHVRRQQDEYLEWHADRDAAGDLTALTFTAEPPDYWQALADVSPDLVWELYKKILKRDDVAKEDLFPTLDRGAFGVDLQGNPKWFALHSAGRYDPLNLWTTTRGIVHLTHQANTLGAEIRLAGDASRKWSTPTLANVPPEIARIACGRYGGVNRSSDPLIGDGVGGAVAGGSRVTLTDPIGLYISAANVSSLTGPQGQPVGAAARKVLRGQDDPFNPRIVRFEIRLPQGAPFKLSECRFEGRTLKRGGQIARQTTMHLFAHVYPGSAVTAPASCEGKLCRDPSRTNVFYVPGVREDCPTSSDPRWALETPLLPGAPGGTVSTEALDALAPGEQTKPVAEPVQVRQPAPSRVLSLPAARSPKAPPRRA